MQGSFRYKFCVKFCEFHKFLDELDFKRTVCSKLLIIREIYWQWCQKFVCTKLFNNFKKAKMIKGNFFIKTKKSLITHHYQTSIAWKSWHKECRLEFLFNFKLWLTMVHGLLNTFCKNQRIRSRNHDKLAPSLAPLWKTVVNGMWFMKFSEFLLLKFQQWTRKKSIFVQALMLASNQTLTSKNQLFNVTFFSHVALQVFFSFSSV